MLRLSGSFVVPLHNMVWRDTVSATASAGEPRVCLLRMLGMTREVQPGPAQEVFTKLWPAPLERAKAGRG